MTIREQIAQSTTDAINVMVKRRGEDSCYLAYNAYTGEDRIFGGIYDSHSESYLYAVLTFDDDRLRVALQDCWHREFEYVDPYYQQLVLEALNHGSKSSN